MSWSSSRRKLLAITLLTLLVLFLFRPGVNSLRERIRRSISSGIGRRVEIGSVSLHLMPRPGFDLDNLEVYEDPAFGAEPMLRATQATASLRITSLLRGHIEIARLDMSDPSVNLVRSSGRWNLEGLLEQAVQPSQPAAGGQTTGLRVLFPYLQANRARINLKVGTEKKPYALIETDFSLWQNSESSWGMRLKGQPTRSDINLGDGGVLRADAEWQVAASLHDTPFRLNLQWDRAQLGQISKFFYGSDKGWRGTAKLNALLMGTPSEFSITTSASVQDFRRFDIAEGGRMRLGLRCAAHYSSINHAFSEIDCASPVGVGIVRATGSVTEAFGDRAFDLKFALQDLPMGSLVDAAQHAKKDLPSDLVAAGKLDGSALLTSDTDKRPVWTGGGEVLGLGLSWESGKAQASFDRIPLALTSADGVSRSLKRKLNLSDGEVARSQTRLEVGPVSVSAGRPSPLDLRAWVSRTSYDLRAQGEAQIPRLAQLAATLGIYIPNAQAGSVRVDVRMAGDWSGFKRPNVVGTAQIHGVEAEFKGANSPITILAANLILNRDQVEVRNLVVGAAGSSWKGELFLPRPLLSAGSGVMRFDLHADEVSTDRLNLLLNPGLRKKPWYGFIADANSAERSAFLSLRAAGKLTADRLVMKKLVANRVVASAELGDGKLHFSELRAEFLGGSHTGEWSADFTAKPPSFSGNGALVGVALTQLGQLMHDNWITGVADGTYEVGFFGTSLGELLSSLKGNAQMQARDGLLPHLTLPANPTPTHMRRLAGNFVLANSNISVQEGRLDTQVASYQLTGTASLTRSLSLRLARERGQAFNITGSLAQPKVTALASPATEAVATKP